MTGKIRIAHLAGANATIQSAPPLVTSNKARMNHQLPLRCGPDGTPLATMCCVPSGWPHPPRSMSNSSPLIRWRAMRRSCTGRQMATSRPTDRLAESARDRGRQCPAGRSPRSSVTRQEEGLPSLCFRGERLRAFLLPSRSISLYRHVGERVIAVVRLQLDLVELPAECRPHPYRCVLPPAATW